MRCSGADYPVVATIAAMLAASWIAGLLWDSVFSFPLPSFIAGMIGGLAALPCWELLGAPSHCFARGLVARADEVSTRACDRATPEDQGGLARVDGMCCARAGRTVYVGRDVHPDVAVDKLIRACAQW
jgi:hypothetical protein